MKYKWRRDAFYINAYPEIHRMDFYGMEFNEFIKTQSKDFKHLLLINTGYREGYKCSTMNFKVIDEPEIKDLLKEDIYFFGDFCWVDYNSKDNIEKLTQAEMDELFEFGQSFEPVNSPFFPAIDNKYAYLSHDDGWFCRLYYKNYKDSEEIIATKAVENISLFAKRKVSAFPTEIKTQLLTLAASGLLIDYSGIIKNRKSISVPIYTIGKFTNMDDMYNGIKKHIANATYSAYLVYENNAWTLHSLT